MKIIREHIQQQALEEFADTYDLVMKIIERPLPVGNPGRFYACFEHTEVAENGMLIGVTGDSHTAELAIYNYVAKISCKTICVNANNYKGKERRIEVPRLVYGGGEIVGK